MTAKSDLGDTVAIERTFEAPVARVWKALTDVDQMRQWYFDLKQFKPEVGFEFGFVVEHEGNTMIIVAESRKSFRKKKSPTLGDTKAMKASRWSRLNYFPMATKHD
jgi:hypothetical protein